MTTVAKLKALRDLMKQQQVAAYYVPSADPHLSEYLPECWKRRAWLSGFTGSAGELLVGARDAALWTDGRYFYQASLQLAGTGIDLMKLGQPETPSPTAWLAARLRKGAAVGVDPTVMSVAQADRFERELAPHGVKVKYLARNLVDRLWADRPSPSLAPVAVHSARFAGETVGSKLKRVRAELASAGAAVHVVGALDAVAWLLNIRSADILYTPVAISYVVVTPRECTLYLDARKVTDQVLKHLGKICTIKEYRQIGPDLRTLARKRPRVWLDPATTNRWIQNQLKGCACHSAPSPIMAMKAVKNPTQIAGVTAAHVRDGVAMVKFLRWLEKAVPAGGVTEISAADRLREFRAEAKEFRDLSFDTISAYAGNGSIIHYSADDTSNARIKPRGLYLIDSGAQYPDGTTDITRTVALSPPSRRMKECFTRVLMGTIDCTRTPFPAGTTGRRIEISARRNLWLGGLDYNHGTGHGLGQYLGVHEGPHSLKDLDTPPVREGNLFSIEPGCYEDGKFGIRCENLAFVVRDERLTSAARTWLRFETVTLCPFDLALVERDLMSRDQVGWLNAYHQRVYRALSPHLDRAHRAWLKRATRAI
ncbi:MAG TPA: aminopeptidase P family protein [Candidatus Krumholzibacteria bacterium]|nr:aminopeptidase P family protein [Candidatus Krumholzibacteria bacterium]HPD70840.1 aminopeptidase P family protein [Candidatus Krumholzibacteria bacterium]HRY39460.1 aminopeptidase P family protein [Candidatus Krumholzibacteria bacterium]